MAETIKSDMFKSLYDFESYEPIETKIDSLKDDCYGDTLIFDDIMIINMTKDKYYGLKEEYKEQEKFAKDHIPTAYSSEISDRDFEKAVDKMGELREEIKSYALSMDSLLKDIIRISEKCEGKQYGWFVTHKYRCKTKEGTPTISTIYYFMDNECKRIIRQFDEDDMSLDSYREYAGLTIERYNSNKNNN